MRCYELPMVCIVADLQTQKQQFNSVHSKCNTFFDIKAIQDYENFNWYCIFEQFYDIL